MIDLGPVLGKILDDIEKDFGQSIFIGTLPEFKFIPFSSPQLNYLLRGGIPYGASSEIVGEEHSGKSTLLLDLISNYQKQEIIRVEDERARLTEEIKGAKGRALKDLEAELDNVKERVAVYLDIEMTTNPQWMKKMGVDETKVVIYQPKAVGIEEPLDHILKMMETDVVGFVAIDSVGQMISTAEQESEVGKGNYGGISKSLTKYYKKASPLYSKNKIAHVVVNQTRQDLSGYNQLVRPGGNAHKFAQSVVLRLRPGAMFDEKYTSIPRKEATVHARETIVNLVKNKMTGSDRQTTSFTIKPNYGIDVMFDTAEMAMEIGAILKGGSWYTIIDMATGEVLTKVQGIAAVMSYLEENEEYYNGLKDYLYAEAIKDEDE